MDGEDEEVRDGGKNEMMMEAAPRAALVVISSWISLPVLKAVFDLETPSAEPKAAGRRGLAREASGEAETEVREELRGGKLRWRHDAEAHLGRDAGAADGNDDVDALD